MPLAAGYGAGGTTFDRGPRPLLPFAVHLLCVIPARIGSRRLREKPLRLLAGEPLVRVVARRVLEAGLEARVVVATDDPRVVAAVRPIGVEGVLTSTTHPSGTDRVAAVARLPRFREAQVVLNVQGDEPLLPDVAMRGAIGRVERGDRVGTAAAPLGPGAMADPHTVKVAVDDAGRARGFSRTVPPSGGGGEMWRHLGVYAYAREALLEWAGLAPTREELDEGLEQLRALAHGIAIGVARIAAPVAPGIDTEDDLVRAEARLT